MAVGSTDFAHSPIRVEPLVGSEAVHVACAKYHSAAITSDGHLLTWGWGRGGRLVGVGIGLGTWVCRSRMHAWVGPKWNCTAELDLCAPLLKDHASGEIFFMSKAAQTCDITTSWSCAITAMQPPKITVTVTS
eukprot:1157888-Pelagomonas_calceolata.AAC.6